MTWLRSSTASSNSLGCAQVFEDLDECLAALGVLPESATLTQPQPHSQPARLVTSSGVTQQVGPVSRYDLAEVQSNLQRTQVSEAYDERLPALGILPESASLMQPQPHAQPVQPVASSGAEQQVRLMAGRAEAPQQAATASSVHRLARISMIFWLRWAFCQRAQA